MLPRAAGPSVVRAGPLRQNARLKPRTKYGTPPRKCTSGSNAYNGLGAVVASQTQSNSSPYWNLEEFRADRIGNVWYSRSRKAAAADSESATSFYTSDGLLRARLGAFPPGCAPGTVHLDTLYQIADAAGNVIRAGELRQSGCDNNANNHQSASNSYYTAHNKLAVVQKWTDASHTWEEYWYDALGRRVFTRTRHDLPMCGYPIVCPGFVDRTVWDGDQIIAEQRSSGLDSVTGGAPNFGTVRYVHGLGLDAPVAILDNRFTDARVIHYNWRGLAEASSWSNGNPADLELGAGVKVAWPAGQGVYLKKGNNPNVGQEVTWIGSLPANGQGDAGLVYRRNRFFDPASGRFTQEDPIGIAGGLNLYGFANGDPVNFSDPFGLCKEKKLSDVFRCVAWRLKKFQKGVEIAWGVESAVLPLGEETAVITSLELGGGRAASGMGSARALGEAGEAAAGIVKNTERIPSATGTAAFRVPDGLTATTLTEVKNVARLGLTNQLRDFAAFAKATGREFDLVVRSTTELSKPLQDFIRAEGINVRFLP